MRAPSGGAVFLATTVPVVRPVDVPVPARRRAVGMVVLLLAGTAILVTSRLLAAGVVGDAAATPIPEPPPIGSCVILDPGDEVTLVPCSQPHTGEIAMTWPAGVEPTARSFVAGSAQHFSVTRTLSSATDFQCAGWVQDYVGWSEYIEAHADDLWMPPQPMASGSYVSAPAGQGLPDRHWSACVVRTSDPKYSGALRNVSFSAASPRPVGVSVCLELTATKVAFPDCSRAHNAELLGSIALTQDMMFRRSVTIDYTEAQVQHLCVALAAQRIGRSDPTIGGQLEIVTQSVWQQSLKDRTPASSSWLIPDCLVRLSGSGRMIGSVVGLGDAPLPLDR